MRRSYKEKVVINTDYKQLKEYLINLPKVFQTTGETIYEGRNTLKTFDVDGLSLNVKSFKKPHIINQIAYANFRESKAKRSYTYAKKLLELGINTPTPIAYMEFSRPGMLKYSLYVCEHIEVDNQLRVLQTGTIDEHRELIIAFAKFTAKLHSLKVLHLDYSSGNILYTLKDGVYTFYLVDLNRMEFGKDIDIHTATRNFRRLWGSDEMFILFAKEYAKARGFDVDQCISLLFEYRMKFWLRFNKQYPNVKRYIGKEMLKIGYDAKRATLNFTGLGNYSRFIIKNMTKIFPNISYFLYTPRPASLKMRDELSSRNNTTHVVKFGIKPFWRTTGIIKDIKKQNLDIYHGLSNELPIGIDRIRTKSIVTIHDLIFRLHPQFYPLIDRIIYDAKAKYACKHADRIVAVSECTKRDIVRLYNIKPEKIDVVYQGCFPIFAQAVSEEARSDVRKTYNLPSNYILSVGSIEARKNILLVIKALKELPNVHFVAIGREREYAHEIEKYIKDNNLSNRVHIFNDIPQCHLPAIFQQASLFVYPSIYEGFGIPILEAQNSGIPVIAATGSCLEEAGGEHSIYVDPYNEKQLAFEINRVLGDEMLREDMIAKGKEYVKKFSPEKCIDNLMQVYNKVLYEN